MKEKKSWIKVMSLARQGDLTIVHIKCDADLERRTKEHVGHGSKTVREGEQTGHAHTLEHSKSNSCSYFFNNVFSEIWAGENPDYLIYANQDDTLVHQEHAPVKIKKGVNVVFVAREFDEEETERKILD